MNLQHSRRGRRRTADGLTLLEMLVYMSVLFVVLGLAFSAFYQCQTNAAHLQRASQQIARALRAGEEWREDVRQSGGLSFAEEDGRHIIRLSTSRGEVAYAQTSSNVMRRLPGRESWVVFLENVKSSEMRVEKRNDLLVCGWDIEFVSPRKTAKVKPIFSFLAVAGGKELK